MPIPPLAPGQVHKMRSWTTQYHKDLKVTWNVNLDTPQKKKHKVAVFLLLGFEPADGTDPIKPEDRLNQMGWTYKEEPEEK